MPHFLYIFVIWAGLFERDRRLVGSDPRADEPVHNSAAASFVKK